ncbi:MAG: DUF6599 family protein [Polyangiaceae bacterium]
MKKVRTALAPPARPRPALLRGLPVLAKAATVLAKSPAVLTKGATVLVMASAVLACEPDKPHREPPPPVESAPVPGVCATAESAPRDPFARALLPLRTGTFCSDPNASEKAYGDDADKPFDRACDELLDGECEIYRSYGALRTMEVRYVDDAGTRATMTVLLTKFATSEGAYAMFTRRVVGDGDPASETAPRPIEARALAASGANNAYVVRGPFLAEVVLTDSSAGTAAALRAASERLVHPFAKQIAQKLTGDTAPPPAAALLPTEGQIPLGVRYHTKDMFDLPGAGPGAIGYYRDGERRYRMVILVRRDADQAKDLLGTIARSPGAAREKSPNDSVVRLVVQPPGELPSEWYLSRSRGVVAGIGDEIRVLRDTMTAEERDKLLLSKPAKLEKLKSYLATVAKP